MNKIPRIGVGVLILKDEQILLGKRNPDPEKADSLLHGEGTWTLPGGKLDFGESVKECAKRETEEETSIKISKLKLISISDDIVDDAHFVTIGFLSEHFEGEVKTMEPDEIVEWNWFPLNKLPRQMFFPSEKMIKNFLDGEMYKH
jgi:ADP-ribose pyrophosphatase YjhB (NUDIX family)